MTLQRLKTHYRVISSIEDPEIVINDDYLLLQTQEYNSKKIPLKDIKSIKISIVNRIYTPSIGILEGGVKGFLSHRNAGVFSIYFNYFIDLNICTNDCAYYFESTELENASIFILELNKRFPRIDDPLGLITLFSSKSYDDARLYIDKNYKDWANKFELENPRTTLDTAVTSMVNNKVNKKLEKKK